METGKTKTVQLSTQCAGPVMRSSAGGVWSKYETAVPPVSGLSPYWPYPDWLQPGGDHSLFSG